MLRTAFAIAAIYLAGVVSAAEQVSPIQWEPLYEPGNGGATTSVRVSPHDPKLIVSGGDMLGVAVSRDQGQTWESTFGLQSYEAADVSFHPTDPNVIWVGTMGGPHVSTDAGHTWSVRRDGLPELVGAGYSAPIETVLFDPSNPDRLLAFGGSSRRWPAFGLPVGYGPVWESLNGGRSWSHLSTLTAEGSSSEPVKVGEGVNIVAASFAPDIPGRVYALAADRGVYVSDDSGKTWHTSNSGLPHTSVNRLAVSSADGNTLYVSMGFTKRDGESQFDAGGIYKSTDGGKTWTDSSGNLPRTRDPNAMMTAHYPSLAISPVDPDVLWTCDARWNTGVVYRSGDGGKTWSPVATKQNIGRDETTPERKALLDTPRVKTGTFAGLSLGGLTAAPDDAQTVYGFGTEYLVQSTDSGKTWTDITSYQPNPADLSRWRGRGWAGWCATNVSFDPYTRGRAIVQAMDAGRAWVSDDGFRSFRYPAADPSPWDAGNDISFTRDGHVYGTTGQFGTFGGIIRSTDGGKTFVTLDGVERGLPKAGTNPGPEGRGVYALPTDASKVWVVLGDDLMHSADGGEKWTKVADAPSGARWLAGDPKKSERFYLSAADGLFVTDDGVKFTALGGPRPAGGGRLNIDSLGNVYTTMWREGRAGVWRYQPDTRTWTRLLDEFLAKEVAVDPSNPNRLAVATSQDPYFDNALGSGVWISADAGKTWSQQLEGLAIHRVTTVAFDPFDSTRLVAGTLGRGYFTAVWPVDYKPVGTRTYESNPEDAADAAVLQSPPVAAAAAAPALAAGVLKNGSMSDGSEIPDQWGTKWVGEGEIQTVRDTVVFHSKPASLRVANVNGKAKGQTAQTIDLPAGGKFKLSGWVKTEGKASVNFGIQFYNDRWTPIGFVQVKYLSDTTNWTHSAGEFDAPAGTVRAGVLLLIDGEGKAWLDDVELTPIP